VSARCRWCTSALADQRSDAVYCCKRCRQSAWRFARQIGRRARAATPLRLAYADPPYPGLSARYYADHPDYAGEVDHRALLERLATYDGWALSTSARPGLQLVLGLCAELGLDVRVASWTRGPRPTRSAWPLASWEPVVYAGGRQVDDGSPSCRSDSLVHHARPRTSDPARVVGAKPAAFAGWLFELLGARPGDQLDDLFPGSGGIGRAWSVFESRAANGDASLPGGDDRSQEYSRDMSPRGVVDASAPSDGSVEDLGDVSPRGVRDRCAECGCSWLHHPDQRCA
jgi:hypothetical protein